MKKVSRAPLGPLGPQVFALLSLLGCTPMPPAPIAPLEPDPQLLVLTPTAGPIATDAPISILTPPETFAVWVPSQIDRTHDLLVGEHWVVFKLKESEWFTERALAAVVPPATGEASPRDLTPLGTVTGFEHAVVPYRESK